MLDLEIVEKIPENRKPWWYTGVTSPNWGGRRKGAGRPKKEEGISVRLEFNPIQQRLLIEYGGGDLKKGIERLINENF